MKCPLCSNEVGEEIMITTRPVEIRFKAKFNPQGKLVRSSEFDGVEDVNIDKINVKTHNIVCPKCSGKIDPEALVYVPFCVRCGKAKPLMSMADNTCRYDGLVCLDCQAARLNYCSGCQYLTSCKLGKRVIARQTA